MIVLFWKYYFIGNSVGGSCGYEEIRLKFYYIRWVRDDRDNRVFIDKMKRSGWIFVFI